MKRTFFLSLLIVFFTVSLVGCNNQKSTKEEQMKTVKELYELQEKCGKRCEERFKNNYKPEYAMYQSHYNKKLNKCFILVHFFKQNIKALFDVNENKQYGIFSPNIEDKSSCGVLEKECKTEDEWNALVKPYMEE